MNTVESVASNCFSYDSLPEPERLAAEFVYQSYLKDETVNATPSSKAGCIVNLSFSLASSYAVDDAPLESASIHSAADLIVNKMSQVTIRDTGLLKRAYESFDRSCRLRRITGNSTDRSLKLSSFLTGSSLTVRNTLSDVAGNYAAQALSFFSANQVIDSGKFSEAHGLPVSALISDRVVYDVFENSEMSLGNGGSTSLGLLANESLLERQNFERARGPKILDLESDTVFLPESVGRVSLRIELVSIQIERTILLTDGSSISEIIANIDPSSTTYTDTTVRYGSKYVYSARAVYRVPVLNGTTVDDPARLRNLYALIASVPSNLATVTTVERVPPPYPVDVSFRFDYQRSELSVRWEFPVNRVQDITRFQVFRRSSVREPFLLLKELDFDKSEFKVSRPDEPLPVNVSKSDSPVRSYVDRDFGRSSTYIYAVAAVDAHGYVSNYSAQYEVKFDTRTRGLRVRSISPAGAPRPYPNLYYSERAPLIEDTITRSKVSSVNFIFDPEYLRVNDRLGNDLNLIRFTGDGAKYYLNVIDTARAEQISVPVEILNARTS